MRFSELPLYCAIHRVRESIRKMSEEGSSESLSSSYWERGEGAIELTRMISEELVVGPNESYIEAFVRYRKQGNVSQEKLKKLDIIAALYCHSQRCFYEGRGLGPCSEEVDLDRIIPGSKGGEYTVPNCIISCSAHNRQRGDKDR